MNDNKPPTVNEVLIRVLNKSRVKSAHVPVNNFEAAQWWIDIQEPADEWRDRPEATSDPKGETVGWKTPYHDRLAYNLRKFLTLPETEKAFVLHHGKNGVPYRGDDINMFKMICAESAKMKDNPEYIDNVKRVARGYLNGMGVSNARG